MGRNRANYTSPVARRGAKLPTGQGNLLVGCGEPVVDVLEVSCERVRREPREWIHVAEP